MYDVLFVCTGNICRSPLAEGYFRHLAQQEGLDRYFRADSAGTRGFHVGEPPDIRARDIAKTRGFSIDEKRARAVQDEDFSAFNTLVALDSTHYVDLTRRAPPESRFKTVMLMDHVPNSRDKEVPDPYYGDMSDFERAMTLIEQGVQGLLRRLKDDLDL